MNFGRPIIYVRSGMVMRVHNKFDFACRRTQAMYTNAMMRSRVLNDG